MKPPIVLSGAIVVGLLAAALGSGEERPGDAPLPPGVSAQWDLALACHETSPTRERICINGLWRFQPAPDGAASGPASTSQPAKVPADRWGHFKVPGCWPGITDYMQKDCQRVFPHPDWKDTRLRDLTAAWYERMVVVPESWGGRRITLSIEQVNSRARVFVDGKEAGEVRFPAGEVDLTPVCRPGERHRLSLLVRALPLRAVLASFTDTAAPHDVRGSVARRGLCGDLYLESAPAGARLGEARIETSVAKERITLVTELQGLLAERRYRLGARVTQEGRTLRELRSPPFGAADLERGRFAFSESWRPERLWDLHTPERQLRLEVSLHEAGASATGGEALDVSYPSTFGFRELEIRGRDFFLNGSRIYLSALPLDNAQVGAAWATYEGARESLSRLKGFGINFVYTHNYGCEPGTHLGFGEVLRAADDVGMLVALSQPHFGQYDWKASDADEANGYARHAEFYARVAGNHPSVVFYSMSHNATGYSEDMSPDLIDGTSSPRDTWSQRNARLALRAEAIVHRLDPSRIVYHHSSGNLSSMHTSNFYTNFAPIQELDDWFERWATEGTKPVFTCEYMVPCTWDWTLYRGWYRGKREFGSARVPWDYSIAEWSAQLLGDRAYRISAPEKANIRWEAKQFQAGNLWHRWDYPYAVGSTVFDVQHEIIARYLQSNWRAFRAWGVSATSPWEHHFYWSLKAGVDRGPRELEVDWQGLQRPGPSPDYLDERPERWDLAFERSDWVPTADGAAILRNNQPLLAYIAGKPAAFTSKDHLFTPGETVEKQLVVINNSRETVTCEAHASLGLPQPLTVSARVTVPTGEQARIPLRFVLPPSLAPGSYELAAIARFGTGETQADSFPLHVLPGLEPLGPSILEAGARTALFDPVGETAKWLEELRFPCRRVDARADLSGDEVLIVGKGALTLDGPAPDLRRVREGLRVLLFEQTAEVLERRLGFRVAEQGLRQVFPRVPDHPLLSGLDTERLRDWRGAATLLPPRLAYELSPRLNNVPVVRWCGLEVSHVWRCGNRGNVASALIEKPARGDFLPILDGGFSLQYSPLLVHRDGAGLLVLCQMDVTGRTETDPAAERLARNLLELIAKPLPQGARTPSPAVQLAGGGAAIRDHLEASGLSVTDPSDGPLRPDRVLVLGSSDDSKGAASASAIAEFLKAGGRLLALGLDEAEANRLLPFRVEIERAEHIASTFDPAGAGSLLAGIGPADVHNRAPREVPLVRSGAVVVGDGVLARAEGRDVVFCQLAPHEVTGARGASTSLASSDEAAVEGARSALLTVGSVSTEGCQLGQKLASGEAGKLYTLAVFARSLGEPVPAHLEIRRPGRPQDRAARGDDVLVPVTEWIELRLELRVERPFSEGWFAGLSCAREGARLRLDNFRLHEGPPAPGQLPAGARNLLANPGFEAGTEGWSLEHLEQQNVRRTFRRVSFLLTRLLANLGAAGATPLLERFWSPPSPTERRWLQGFYLDEPQEWDDPYRFFRW